MSSKTIGLALAIALAAGATPALAGGDVVYRDGSSKDYRGAGIPVPAPIPVMEHFRWYLRADMGLGLLGGGAPSETGLIIGAQDATGVGAQTPFGTSSSWFTDDFNTFVSGGVGVGMYLTPHLRGDLTVEARTKSDVIGDGAYSYAQWAHTIPVPGPTGTRVDGSLQDKTEVRDTTTMINLYYDFKDRGGFTPYIGAGVGVAVRTLQRTSTLTETLYDVTGPIPVLTGTRTLTGTGKAHVPALAAALTLGASYALHPGMVLDFNYRYMYTGEGDVKGRVGGQPTTLTVGETHEHALRAGLRINVW